MFASSYFSLIFPLGSMNVYVHYVVLEVIILSNRISLCSLTGIMGNIEISIYVIFIYLRNYKLRHGWIVFEAILCPCSILLIDGVMQVAKKRKEFISNKLCVLVLTFTFSVWTTK